MTGNILAAILAYLIGAIPTGYIFTKLVKRVDIRQHGSGNIGATNVFRTLGTRLGLITALLDLGKAALAVWLGMLIIGNDAFPATSKSIYPVVQVVKMNLPI